MIFRSPYPDVRVPDVALHRFVLAGAAGRADQPALIDGPSGRALTYGQLARGVERLAAGLAARGFRRGDVLALFMPNLPEFALAFHGTLAAGGVVTTVNSLATVQDAEYQLRNPGARLLVTVAPFLDRPAQAAPQGGLEPLFVVGAARGPSHHAGVRGPAARPRPGERPGGRSLRRVQLAGSDVRRRAARRGARGGLRPAPLVRADSGVRAYRGEPGDSRRVRRAGCGAPRLDRPAVAEYGVPCRRSGERQRSRPRRGRRAVDPGSPGDGRVLEQPGGDRRHARRRRVVAHG